MIPIFLSRPNPFTDEQVYFLDKLIEKIKDAHCKNITLETKDYNPYESLTCLSELIKRTYGMIIVAFGQHYIENGISKKGAQTNELFFNAHENILNQTWITSPFCQIEGTIAFENNLPILILKQHTVKTEGILESGDHAIQGPTFQLNNNEEIDAYFADPTFVNSFTEWYEKVFQLYDFINRVT